MKQRRPGPQSESLWQGSDMHVPVGPPSAPTPVPSQDHPIGQSELFVHARASARRGDAVSAAKMQTVRTQTARRVFMTDPRSPTSVAAAARRHERRRLSPKAEQAGARAPESWEGSVGSCGGRSRPAASVTGGSGAEQPGRLDRPGRACRPIRRRLMAWSGDLGARSPRSWRVTSRIMVGHVTRSVRSAPSTCRPIRPGFTVDRGGLHGRSNASCGRSRSVFSSESARPHGRSDASSRSIGRRLAVDRTRALGRSPAAWRSCARIFTPVTTRVHGPVSVSSRFMGSVSSLDRRRLVGREVSTCRPTSSVSSAAPVRLVGVGDGPARR
jgi:hypothetical protein